MTADDVIAALRAHFERDAREWVVMREAWGIDVLAWCLDPLPRPYVYERAAFEVKVDRADFMGDVAQFRTKQALAVEMAHTVRYAMPFELWREADAEGWLMSPARDAGVVLVHDDGLTLQYVRDAKFRTSVKQLDGQGEMASLMRYVRAATQEGVREAMCQPLRRRGHRHEADPMGRPFD